MFSTNAFLGLAAETARGSVFATLSIILFFIILPSNPLKFILNLESQIENEILTLALLPSNQIIIHFNWFSKHIEVAITRCNAFLVVRVVKKEG